MACSDQFTIIITGEKEECTIEIDSDDETLNFSVEDRSYTPEQGTLPPVAVTAIGATYTLGIPPVTVFASSWSKRRVGGQSGDAPDLPGGMSFEPGAPVQGGASNAPKDVTVTIGLPSYTPDDVTALGTGKDIYDCVIYARGATEVIGGNPSNLDPPNP